MPPAQISATVRSIRPGADATESPDHIHPDQLVLEHLWLADTIARRFRGRGEDDEDLGQVARCALVEAARRYDPARGPFVAYASPTISGVIKRHFRDHGWTVRPPRSTQQIAVRISQQWSEVAQMHRTDPQDRDLAAMLGETVPKVREARRASQGYRAVSLDAAPIPAGALLTDDVRFAHCEDRMVIARAWRLLDRREQDLLSMRFWEQCSQSEIAARIGTSQMQVSRLLRRVLDRLHDHLEDRELRPAS